MSVRADLAAAPREYATVFKHGWTFTNCVRRSWAHCHVSLPEENHMPTTCFVLGLFHGAESGIGPIITLQCSHQMAIRTFSVCRHASMNHVVFEKEASRFPGFKKR